MSLVSSPFDVRSHVRICDSYRLSIISTKHFIFFSFALTFFDFLFLFLVFIALRLFRGFCLFFSCKNVSRSNGRKVEAERLLAATNRLWSLLVTFFVCHRVQRARSFFVEAFACRLILSGSKVDDFIVEWSSSGSTTSPRSQLDATGSNALKNR